MKSVLMGMFFVGAVATTTYAAEVTKSQEPCKGKEFEQGCLKFDNSKKNITVRSFSLKAPGPGTAKVTFHGSLVCFNKNVDFRTNIGFHTQIVENKTLNADGSGPGGLTQFGSMEGPVESGETTYSDYGSFNLASTRVLKVQKKGDFEVHMRANLFLMDDGVECTTFNSAFTVDFVS